MNSQSSQRIIETKGQDYGSKGADGAELASELRRIQSGINTFADEAKKRHGELSADTKATVDKLLAEQASCLARIADLERKAARRSDGGYETHSTGNPINELANSEPERLAELERQPGQCKLTAKGSLAAMSRSTKTVTADVGSFPSPAVFRPEVTNFPPANSRLVESLPSILFTGSSLEFPQLTDAYVNNAGLQLLEGDAKLESDPTIDPQTAQIVTIAHWSRASRQVLSDVPLLRASLSNLLQVGLLNKVDAELIGGTGIGRRMLGLLTAATAAVVTALKPSDAVGEAAVQLASSGWLPDLVILNPVDEFRILSERTVGGEYVGSGWAAPAPATFWALQRVTTPALAAGTAIVMQRSAVLLLDRESPVVLVSSEDRDNFIKNLVTLLCECRLGLAILSPRAIKKVALPA